ncbi:hypothetical protein DW991_04430 [Bacteroides thetaiotaomicron]|nr:hypothetical protein DW991_04430 [Bacteroides thetaiotaomicron]
MNVRKSNNQAGIFIIISLLPKYLYTNNKKGPGFFSLEVHRDRIKSEHKVVSQLYIEIVFVS